MEEIMKKVIKGRVYDTSTAKKLSECDNGVYGNDITPAPKPCTAQNRDATFLHGCGGANTKYATDFRWFMGIGSKK